MRAPTRRAASMQAMRGARGGKDRHGRRSNSLGRTRLLNCANAWLLLRLDAEPLRDLADELALLVDRGAELGRAARIGHLRGLRQPRLERRILDNRDHVGTDPLAQLERHALRPQQPDESLLLKRREARLD